MKLKTLPSSSSLLIARCDCNFNSSSSFSSYTHTIIIASKNKKQQNHRTQGSEPPPPPRITSNVKQNLHFLRLCKEFQKRSSSTPRPSTSYRKKKVEKQDVEEDQTDLYRDPTTSLYYTNQQGIENAVPVLLVDGYNVCGYWMKLKKHFMKGRLDIARQKLLDELVTYSMSVDIIFSGETCADTWIEKEVSALREDGCPKVWVVTSDLCQQQAAHGAGAFVWSCKALVTEIKASHKELESVLQETRSTSFQGRLLKHNLDAEVVDALKNLRQKLSENELR